MLANILSRYWYMTLLRGIIAILFGLFIFAQPSISLATLTLVFGAFAFFDGLANITSAIAGRDEHEHWWLLLLAGLCGIGIAVLTFYNPGITVLALIFYIGVWAITLGIVEFVAAIRLRKEIENEFWLGLAGLLSIAFGIFLIARPAAGALSLLWLLGGYAIASGIVLIAFAFRARGFFDRLTTTARS